MSIQEFYDFFKSFKQDLKETSKTWDNNGNGQWVPFSYAFEAVARFKVHYPGCMAPVWGCSEDPNTEFYSVPAHTREFVQNVKFGYKKNLRTGSWEPIAESWPVKFQKFGEEVVCTDGYKFIPYEIIEVTRC